MRSVIVLLVALAAIAYPIGRELLQSSDSSSSGSSSSGSSSSGSSSSGSSSSGSSSSVSDSSSDSSSESGSSSSGSSSSGSSSSGSSSSGSSSSGSSSSGSSSSGSSSSGSDLCTRDALLALKKNAEKTAWVKTCCAKDKYTEDVHKKYCKDNKGKVKSDDGKKDLNNKECKALYADSICKKDKDDDKDDDKDVCKNECELKCFDDKKDGDVAKWQKNCCEGDKCKGDDCFTKKENKKACADLGGNDAAIQKCEDKYDKIGDKSICPKNDPCDPNKCTLACFNEKSVNNWDKKCCAAGKKCKDDECFTNADNKKACKEAGGNDDKIKKCEDEYKKSICK